MVFKCNLLLKMHGKWCLRVIGVSVCTELGSLPVHKLAYTHQPIY